MDLSSPYPPLVLQLEDVRGMQVERRCTVRERTAELRVAAIAHRQILQPSVDRQIDQRRRRENAVGDEIAAEPVEAGADQRADDDNREPQLGIEILAQVEVAAFTDRAAIDRSA